MIPHLELMVSDVKNCATAITFSISTVRVAKMLRAVLYWPV